MKNTRKRKIVSKARKYAQAYLSTKTKRKSRKSPPNGLRRAIRECQQCNMNKHTDDFYIRRRKYVDGTTYEAPQSHCKSCSKIQKYKY